MSGRKGKYCERCHKPLVGTADRGADRCRCSEKPIVKLEADLISHGNGFRYDVLEIHEGEMKLPATLEKPLAILLINGKQAAVFLDAKVARVFACHQELAQTQALLHDALASIATGPITEENRMQLVEKIAGTLNTSEQLLQKLLELSQGKVPGRVTQ